MPIIKMPSPFRYYTQGLLEVPVNCGTITEAMRSLVDQYPTLRPHLYDSQNKLRPFVHLFLNDQNIQELQGMDTSLGEKDVLRLVPSVAGG